MFSKHEAGNLIGAAAYDQHGEKIGHVAAVYLDKASGEPEWLTVRTGLFGPRETFVPTARANPRTPREIRFDIGKDTIVAAPNVEPDGELAEAEEAHLFRHYGVTSSERRNPTGLERTGRPADGEAEEWMTRSEERMHVATTTEQTGRVRLRKYVVTENVQQTVPVSHEEVRVEREPVTDANRGQAMSGPELSEAEHEVTLHEERVAVTKETVPVERVRLAKERVTGEQTVSGEIRKERVEIEGEPEPGAKARTEVGAER